VCRTLFKGLEEAQVLIRHFSHPDTYWKSNTVGCKQSICERNNSAGTKVCEEQGGGGASDTGVVVPLQSLEKTMVRQAEPLQPMEVHGGADIHLQPVEDPTPEQAGA